MPNQTKPTKISGATAIGIIELILQESPAGIEAIRVLLNKNEATRQDFDDAIAQWDKDTIESLAPDAVRVVDEADAKKAGSQQ